MALASAYMVTRRETERAKQMTQTSSNAFDIMVDNAAHAALAALTNLKLNDDELGLPDGELRAALASELNDAIAAVVRHWL